MSYVSWKSLNSSFKILKNYSRISHFSRTLATSNIFAKNYEGDGKTTVTILNREYKHLIMVDTFSNYGFRLNNGIFAIGPLAAFPRTILQWNVEHVEDLTPESLSLFCLLEPKLDILVIGTGDKRILPNKKVLDYLKSNKITAEILSTYQACYTFNFLNVEGRYVAAAFMPPKEVEMYEDEIEIRDCIDSMDDYTPLRFDPRRQKVPKK